MSSHRARRRRVLGSVPVRAVLSLGVVLGLGTTSTMAYFTDSTTVNSGSFTSGKLDLTLDDDATTVGAGTGGYTKSALGVTALVPGESLAAAIKVKNNGTVPLTWKATGKLSTTTFPATANGLEFEVYAGSTAAATNTGTAAAATRAGTCTGTRIYSFAALPAPTATAADLTAAGARPLDAGASENVCVIVRLNALADNTFQDKNATAVFAFRAAQVGVAP